MYRVPVEIVTVCAIECVAIHDRRRRGASPEPIADLFIEDGRFVAIVYFAGLDPVETPLRVFPVESLAA